MTAVQEWAKDKPLIIQWIAPHLTMLVDDFHEEMRQSKLHRLSNTKFSQPDLADWHKMYRSSRKTFQFVKLIWEVFVGELAECGAQVIQESKKLRNADNATLQSLTPTPEEWTEILSFLREFTDASFAAYEEELVDQPLDPSDQEALKRLLGEYPLEASFFLFVTVPCWLLYRMPPAFLYRKARQNPQQDIKASLDALDKLLRLDPLMLHDISIGKRITWYRFNSTPSKYRKLISATTTQPSGASSRKNILLSLTGFLSAVSQHTQKPLTSFDIIELIEAMDQDAKRNFAKNFPEDQGAVTRALQPDRNLWRKILKTDKKN